MFFLGFLRPDAPLIVLTEVFQQEICRAILSVVESLKDSDEDVRQKAIECLSSLGAHGMLFLVFLKPDAH
jgi:vesicle coat complex subunit